MADSSDKEKSLEMRVAALEDKLRGMEITEEEMRAFNKVSAMLGAPAAGTGVAQTAPAPAPTTPVPDNCVIQQCVRPCVVQQCIRACTVVQNCIRACTVVQPCVVQQCTVVQNCIRACTIIQDCINECGGGFPGGGVPGGGFGTLGG